MPLSWITGSDHSSVTLSATRSHEQRLFEMQLQILGATGAPVSPVGAPQWEKWRNKQMNVCRRWFADQRAVQWGARWTGGMVTTTISFKVHATQNLRATSPWQVSAERAALGELSTPHRHIRADGKRKSVSLRLYLVNYSSPSCWHQSVFTLRSSPSGGGLSPAFPAGVNAQPQVHAGRGNAV